MSFSDLPGPEPQHFAFRELPPDIALRCHPFLTSQQVAIDDLRAFYISNPARPRAFARPSLHIEAGLHLGEPDRVMGAGDGLREAIATAPHSDQGAQAETTLRFLPLLATHAENGGVTTIDDAHATYRALGSWLSEPAPTGSSGIRLEAIMLALAAGLAVDTEDSRYLLCPTPVRRGNSTDYRVNHDAFAPDDNLVVEIKAAEKMKNRDPQILRLRVATLLAGITEYQATRKADRNALLPRRMAAIAAMVTRHALHNETHDTLLELFAALRTKIDDHRLAHPTPPTITPGFKANSY